MTDRTPVPRRAGTSPAPAPRGFLGEIVRSGIIATKLAASTAATSARVVARTADGVLSKLPGGSTYQLVRDVVARQLEELQDLPIGLDPLQLLAMADAQHLDGEWPSRADLLRVVPGQARDMLPFEVAGRPVDADLARQRFRDLLDRSLEMQPPDEDRVAVAFVNVIDQMTPDEARIVRMLADDQGRAVLDLHAAPRIGFSSGELVLEHLSLIGSRAGCHRPERTPQYLENLLRLGVVRVQDQPVGDTGEYDLIELDDRYVAAAEEITARGLRPRPDRRSVHLTPFGRRFVDICLSE